MSAAILVVIDEHKWTMQALHLAAAMARETAAAIALVEMVTVDHVEYLGARISESLLPYARMEAIGQYWDVVQGYGIPLSVQIFEYSDYVGGVLSAAEQAGARVVFAPPPSGLLPSLRLWYLRRALRRPLYTLGAGDGAAVWSPRPIGVEASR